MKNQSRFTPQSPNDLIAICESHPLAWIIPIGGTKSFGTLVPLRVDKLNSENLIVSLLGHLPRRSQLVEHFQKESSALVLFLGPHGYISPSWMRDRTQAPSWNFATIQMHVTIEIIEDKQFLDHVMRDLVDAVEAGRPEAWTVDDMGSRYDMLAERIIGFRATVISQESKFKLGQDERRDVFDDILKGLKLTGNDELVATMLCFADDKPSN
jgi:transcriptional regulator